MVCSQNQTWGLSNLCSILLCFKPRSNKGFASVCGYILGFLKLGVKSFVIRSLKFVKGHHVMV